MTREIEAFRRGFNQQALVTKLAQTPSTMQQGVDSSNDSESSYNRNGKLTGVSLLSMFGLTLSCAPLYNLHVTTGLL
ncbi:hypothetical protein BYT27DRAFT_7195412 [Phlegmacium glaucopus]|nr:hypothetical protein BYT27DRAFT_7195412 [Phlegmacium glaucopus]